MIPVLKQKIALSGLDMLQVKSPAAFDLALAKGGIQLLTWSANGSMQEPRKPPIDTGTLRGSGSAFVGNRLISMTPAKGVEGTTPAKQHSGKKSTITIGYNTDYAAKQHEYVGRPGKKTLQDADAGPKWIELHLKHDKDALMQMIANEINKGLHL